jgi:hypothetical protein
MPPGVHNGHLKGQDHNMAKLDDRQVQAIRASNESNETLAARFKTCVSNVWLIRSGKTWRHL